MKERLKEVIKYKTNGRKNKFAELMGVTPQYVTKLLKGEDFGLAPVLRVAKVVPELNCRWFLTGEGSMLTEDSRRALSREALGRVQEIMEVERLIPVMTADELKQFEAVLTGQADARFSPAALSSLNARADERINEINTKFAAAAAKSEELCKQKTVRK